jgi:hypothetical protein
MGIVAWKGRAIAELSREELIEALAWYSQRWHELTSSEYTADAARGKAARFFGKVGDSSMPP